MREGLVIKSLSLEDEPHIWSMLCLAAHEPDMDVVRSNPDLSRYAAGWGRRGDFGYAAFSNGMCLGAAWCRLWRGEDRGFGYVSEIVPELAVAVVPEWRALGLGTRLVEALIVEAAEVYPGVSLNVRESSPAVRLYSRLGFVRLPETEIPNRAGGISFTMVRHFR